MPKSLRWCLSILTFGLLTSCYPVGNPEHPIPTALVPADGHAQRLVVILPGRGDDLASLSKRGMAKIIQQAWPHTDVELTGLTMGYYTAGNAIQRLHDEVIEPARQRGYKQVWLLGISLGGLGTLLYDRQYPDQVDGMILLSPYLGEDAIHKQIVASGGLAHWRPLSTAANSDDNWQLKQVQLWTFLHSWTTHPSRVDHVWLGYGDHDRLRGGIDLLAPTLPQNHVLLLPGGHNWKVWKPATRELLRKIAMRHDSNTRP